MKEQSQGGNERRALPPRRHNKPVQKGTLRSIPFVINVSCGLSLRHIRIDVLFPEIAFEGIPAIKAHPRSI